MAPTPTPAGTFTARRITDGAKPHIVLEVDGQHFARFGGARAVRAQAVIVGGHRLHEHPFAVYGTRADLEAARVEAHRLATATTMRAQGVVIPCEPCTWAVAVPVEDEVAS